MRFFLTILSMLMLGCSVPDAAAMVSDEAGAQRVEMASSWGRTLNPQGLVPAEGFRAVYFNRRTPRQPVHAENVGRIAIKYAWSDLHNIDSPNFGGYWVGRMRFAEASTQEISVSTSHSRARIFIDGAVVFDGGDKTSFVHSFAAGEHIVEVEFANGWHTTEFTVNFEDVATINRVTPQDLRLTIQQRAGAAELSYVGLYESAAQDTSVTVSVPRSRRPHIVWLSSYEAIDWTIDAAPDTIALVVVASFTPGSRVRGVPADRVLRLVGEPPAQQPSQVGIIERAPVSRERPAPGPRLFRTSRSCSCSGGSYWHCDGSDDLASAAEQLRAMTGLTMTGFAVQYSADALTITPWNARAQQAGERQRSAEAEAQRQCTATARPDFDTLMQPQR